MDGVNINIEDPDTILEIENDTDIDENISKSFSEKLPKLNFKINYFYLSIVAGLVVVGSIVFYKYSYIKQNFNAIFGSETVQITEAPQSTFTPNTQEPLVPLIEPSYTQSNGLKQSTGTIDGTGELNQGIPSLSSNDLVLSQILSRLDGIETEQSNIKTSLTSVNNDVMTSIKNVADIGGRIDSFRLSQNRFQDAVSEIKVSLGKLKGESNGKLSNLDKTMTLLKDNLDEMDKNLIKLETNFTLSKTFSEDKINENRDRFLKLSDEVFNLSMQNNGTSYKEKYPQKVEYSEGYQITDDLSDKKSDKIISDFDLLSKNRKGFTIVDSVGVEYDVSLGKDLGKAYGIIDDYIISGSDFENSYLITTTNWKFTTRSSKQ